MLIHQIHSPIHPRRFANAPPPACAGQPGGRCPSRVGQGPTRPGRTVCNTGQDRPRSVAASAPSHSLAGWHPGVGPPRLSLINASYSPALSTTVVQLRFCGATVPLFGKVPLPTRILLKWECKWLFPSQFSVKAGRYSVDHNQPLFTQLCTLYTEEQRVQSNTAESHRQNVYFPSDRTGTRQHRYIDLVQFFGFLSIFIYLFKIKYTMKNSTLRILIISEHDHSNEVRVRGFSIDNAAKVHDVALQIPTSMSTYDFISFPTVTIKI